MVIKGAQKLCTIINSHDELLKCKQKGRSLLLFIVQYCEVSNYAVNDYLKDDEVRLFLDIHKIKPFYICSDEAEEVCTKEGIDHGPLIQAYEDGKLKGEILGGINKFELIQLVSNWYEMKQYCCFMGH